MPVFKDATKISGSLNVTSQATFTGLTTINNLRIGDGEGYVMPPLNEVGNVLTITGSNTVDWVAPTGGSSTTTTVTASNAGVIVTHSGDNYAVSGNSIYENVYYFNDATSLTTYLNTNERTNLAVSCAPMTVSTVISLTNYSLVDICCETKHTLFSGNFSIYGCSSLNFINCKFTAIVDVSGLSGSITFRNCAFTGNLNIGSGSPYNIYFISCDLTGCTFSQVSAGHCYFSECVQIPITSMTGNTCIATTTTLTGTGTSFTTSTNTSNLTLGNYAISNTLGNTGTCLTSDGNGHAYWGVIPTGTGTTTSLTGSNAGVVVTNTGNNYAIGSNSIYTNIQYFNDANSLQSILNTSMTGQNICCAPITEPSAISLNGCSNINIYCDTNYIVFSGTFSVTSCGLLNFVNCLFTGTVQINSLTNPITFKNCVFSNTITLADSTVPFNNIYFINCDLTQCSGFTQSVGGYCHFTDCIQIPITSMTGNTCIATTTKITGTGTSFTTNTNTSNLKIGSYNMPTTIGSTGNALLSNGTNAYWGTIPAGTGTSLTGGNGIGVTGNINGNVNNYIVNSTSSIYNNTIYFNDPNSLLNYFTTSGVSGGNIIVSPMIVTSSSSISIYGFNSCYICCHCGYITLSPPTALAITSCTNTTLANINFISGLTITSCADLTFNNCIFDVSLSIANTVTSHTITFNNCTFISSVNVSGNSQVISVYFINCNLNQLSTFGTYTGGNCFFNNCIGVTDSMTSLNNVFISSSNLHSNTGTSYTSDLKIGNYNMPTAIGSTGNALLSNGVNAYWGVIPSGTGSTNVSLTGGNAGIGVTGNGTNSYIVSSNSIYTNILYFNDPSVLRDYLTGNSINGQNISCAPITISSAITVGFWTSSEIFCQGGLTVFNNPFELSSCNNMTLSSMSFQNPLTLNNCGGNISINNCIFGTGSVNITGSIANSTVTFNNCVFGTGSSISISSNNTSTSVYFTNCNLIGLTSFNVNDSNANCFISNCANVLNSMITNTYNNIFILSSSSRTGTGTSYNSNLTIGDYTMPSIVGSHGNILTCDGTGNAYWGTESVNVSLTGNNGIGVTGTGNNYIIESTSTIYNNVQYFNDPTILSNYLNTGSQTGSVCCAPIILSSTISINSWSTTNIYCQNGVTTFGLATSISNSSNMTLSNLLFLETVNVSICTGITFNNCVFQSQLTINYCNGTLTFNNCIFQSTIIINNNNSNCSIYFNSCNMIQLNSFTIDSNGSCFFTNCVCVLDSIISNAYNNVFVLSSSTQSGTGTSYNSNLTIGAYTMPSILGSQGNILTCDGTGNAYWGTESVNVSLTGGNASVGVTGDGNGNYTVTAETIYNNVQYINDAGIIFSTLNGSGLASFNGCCAPIVVSGNVTMNTDTNVLVCCQSDYTTFLGDFTIQNSSSMAFQNIIFGSNVGLGLGQPVPNLTINGVVDYINFYDCIIVDNIGITGTNDKINFTNCQFSGSFSIPIGGTITALNFDQCDFSQQNFINATSSASAFNTLSNIYFTNCIQIPSDLSSNSVIISSTVQGATENIAFSSAIVANSLAVGTPLSAYNFPSSIGSTGTVMTSNGTDIIWSDVASGTSLTGGDGSVNISNTGGSSSNDYIITANTIYNNIEYFNNQSALSTYINGNTGINSQNICIAPMTITSALTFNSWSSSHVYCQSNYTLFNNTVNISNCGTLTFQGIQFNTLNISTNTSPLVFSNCQFSGAISIVGFGNPINFEYCQFLSGVSIGITGSTLNMNVYFIVCDLSYCTTFTQNITGGVCYFTECFGVLDSLLNNGNIIISSNSHNNNNISYTTNTNTTNLTLGNYSISNSLGVSGSVLTSNGTSATWLPSSSLDLSQLNPIAIGTGAGQTSQSIDSVAIGHSAGNTSQGTDSIAIGHSAGTTNQSSYGIAVGSNAGSLYQNSNDIAIGTYAGNFNQNSNAIAVGYYAGVNFQGTGSISMGIYSGQYYQGSDSIAIGSNAGQNYQNSYSVAIGNNAGYTGQGTSSVSVGYNTGYQNQGSSAVAIGNGAGNLSQHDNSVAIGYQAGYNNLGNDDIAIGYQAGNSSSGSQTIAIGVYAGYTGQGDSAVGIGYYAGSVGQSSDAIALGYNSGRYLQGYGGVAIGTNSGMTGQSTYSVAIGYNSAQNNQGTGGIAIGYNSAGSYQSNDAIAIGVNAGNSTNGSYAIAMGTQSGLNQGSYSISLGYQSGNNQSSNGIAIGNQSATSNQGTSSIAIGSQAGNTSQETECVAIGDKAGAYYQGQYAVAVGYQSGYTGQGQNAVAIGYNSGASDQQSDAISIGLQSGQTNQGLQSIAIGAQSGQTSQGQYAIAIGANAGFLNQGQNAIAIGNNAGYQIGSTGQNSNSIVLNASGSALNSGTTGTFINPIRTDVQQSGCYTLNYNPTTSELYTSNVISGQILGMTGCRPDIPSSNVGIWPCYHTSDPTNIQPIGYTLTKLGNIVYYNFNFDSFMFGTGSNSFTGGIYCSTSGADGGFFISDPLSSRPDLFNFLSTVQFPWVENGIGNYTCILLGISQAMYDSTVNYNATYYLTTTGQLILSISANSGLTFDSLALFPSNNTIISPCISVVSISTITVSFNAGRFSGFYFVN